MKEVAIPKTSLGQIALKDAFDVVFGIPTLQNIHGPTLEVSEWKKDERKIKFSIGVTNIPREIRRFFCGDRLRISTKQIRKIEEAEIAVENKLKMHFLGAEFFKIKPRFVLSHEAGRTYISGRVEHHAILPPPLNGIAEAFMAEHSKREIDGFGRIIEAGLLAIGVQPRV